MERIYLVVDGAAQPVDAYTTQAEADAHVAAEPNRFYGVVEMTVLDRFVARPDPLEQLRANAAAD